MRERNDKRIDEITSPFLVACFDVFSFFLLYQGIDGAAADEPDDTAPRPLAVAVDDRPQVKDTMAAPLG